MKLKAFSVYDTKALVFQVPFFMPTNGQAVRAFSDLANDPQSLVYKHPTDFILFEVGEFNDGDGTFKSVIPPVQLGIGSDFQASQMRADLSVAKPTSVEVLRESLENGKK